VQSESEGILGAVGVGRNFRCRVGRNFRWSRKEFLGGVSRKEFWLEPEGILGAVGVGRNFRCSRSRKEFLGGVGV
jgi:hypothetical protein